MTHLVINVVPLSPSLVQRVREEMGFRASLMRERLERWTAPAAQAIDRLPVWAWPLFAAIAGWPSLAWAPRRFGDRSDDPFGIVAWFALVFALLVSRERFKHPPRMRLLVAATASSIVAALPIVGLPDLLRALVATSALVLALAAIVDDDEPFAPYAGFALLALPLLSSLQFYAGFPLRVVTAEASRWLLTAMGSLVARDGSALTVDGRLILVDAPCSGVQMAWVGYFTACFSAWLFRTANGAMGRRLPLVGLLILTGNVGRNTILVALEARGADIDAAAHEAIGLAVVGIVCVAIVAVFATCRDRVRALQRIRVESHGRFFAPQETHRATLLVALGFVVAALLPLARAHAAPAPIAASVEWPTTFDDEALIPVALSNIERHFADDFPGSIARFTNGARVVVLRDVERVTRRLHPASDCYRALGYVIDRERLETDAGERRWRCFDARRDGNGLCVCERIVDAAGFAFTDASSWYWSAVMGRSHGPWRATTVAAPFAGAAT